MQTFLIILDKISALVLEFIIGFFSIIGIFLSFYGLSTIPFYIEHKLIKITFSINILLFIIILLISLIFILFRKLYLINNKLNLLCYYLSIIIISFSLLGFIINVVIDTILINDMYFFDQKAKKNKTIELTSKQWKDTIIVVIIIFIMFLLFIFLGLSDNLRIHLKIDDSYYIYQLAIEEERKIENNQNSLRVNNIDNKKNNLNEKKGNNTNNININDQIGSENEFNKKLEQNEEKK